MACEGGSCGKSSSKLNNGGISLAVSIMMISVCLTSASSPTIVFDVYSDLACPWCYVGKDNLDAAIANFRKSGGTENIEVHWKPFMIDPATAKEGEEYMAYNRRRWGSDGWTYSLPGRRDKYESYT
ncbi:hypothetical protein GUITHDRAFT_102543 [Guillardia theta CCMP2712]|uniref:DSBA-like thioredoxin domain-containing protein n=1 Tax=Guillardia theta (strain CCMP2712) TaxID=905079 RepID=L1JU39_GUITC|nr:hypothetical protein GUITHDRAFT_102543 [Guillardia theta CCMP2712]EKX51932.1 hypothetical protein GUITHDRAFT_102543 [Guillardia theta CCMP2712]|eukprot:XP_005838912.1 hypothetical protein GUITHDRAFT_102543 [Guillardia theta CCMP2712]